MKKKALSYYLDLMKSAQDKQEWNTVKRYGETALKKLPHLSYSFLEEYLLYCQLAKVYTNFANHSHSLNFLYKADRLATTHHFKPPYHAYISFMTGNNLLWLNHFNQAITNFQKVVHYYQTRPPVGQEYETSTVSMDEKMYFITMFRLGYCYLYKNNLKQAKEIIEKILASKLPFKSDDILEQYYHLKGEYQFISKDYNQARQSFQKSLNISEHLKLHRDTIGTKIHLAEIDLLEGRIESAVTSLEFLFKESLRLKVNNFTCRIGLLLYKCYALRNMTSKSVAVERRIKPILKKLESVWLYERVREYERFSHQLQSVYQGNNKAVSPLLMPVLNRHYKSSADKYMIIGQSAPMCEVYQLIEKIAPTDLPILLQGETGTGKELIARTIHNNSLRKGKNWLALNCGALPEALIENELFGHTKGAFTDAQGDRRGYIELTSDGTLFLDEIGNMSPNMQQKLLRVLEERYVWRLGSEKPIKINTRFIFASNQDIESLVKAKKFREDLYHRINTIVITLPPLRDRKDDIPLLVNHFLTKYSSNKTHNAQRSVKPPVGITPSALALLDAYPWPGNIRELENEIERISAVHPHIKQIIDSMLTESIRNYLPIKYPKIKGKKKLVEMKRLFESNMIQETLRKFNGNMTKTANWLGCRRSYLYEKMKQLKIFRDNNVTKK
jgi:DNA-binding NtrC family response regulator